jgi:hypothetical protein
VDGRNEQSFVIKFYFKTRLSATKTLVLVQKAYGDEALNQSNVFRWNSPFRDGTELVEVDERGGRPKSTRTKVNIAAVSNLIKTLPSNCIKNDKQNLRTSPKTVVLRILKQDLGKRKLCACFVPQSLTPEQRED